MDQLSNILNLITYRYCTDNYLLITENQEKEPTVAFKSFDFTFLSLE